MAVTMYNAVREFSSRWYPKKGKKGIGNKNRSPIPIYVDSQKIFLIYERAFILMNQCLYFREIYNGRPSSSGSSLRRHLIDIDPIESNRI